MTTTYHPRPPLNRGLEPSPQATAPGNGGLVRAALVSAGAGLALVVAADGSWHWRLVRAALTVAMVAAAARMMRTRTARAGALVGTSLGLLFVPAGSALGVPFLSREGWSLRAAGGLLAGLGGLVLLVWGLIVVIRSSPGWQRLAAVPVVLLAGYALVPSMAVSVYATNVPRPELGLQTPADHGLDYSDASFLTPDGVRLSGWYIPSANRAAVALLHGASSTRSNVLEEAVVLARHGFGVLLFDARGFGRSDGRAMNLGWHGDRDVAAAVSFLQQRPEVDRDRIGVVGSSMGGESAIGAMAADSRIRVVVGEGVTGRVGGDLRWLSDRYGARGWLQERLSSLTYAVTDVLTAARAPRTLRAAVAAAAPRPVLLVAAGNKVDEQHAAAFIREAAPDSVDVWVVPGAGHTAGLRTEPAEWTERVTSFLHAALLSPR